MKNNQIPYDISLSVINKIDLFSIIGIPLPPKIEFSTEEQYIETISIIGRSLKYLTDFKILISFINLLFTLNNNIIYMKPLIVIIINVMLFIDENSCTNEMKALKQNIQEKLYNLLINNEISYDLINYIYINNPNFFSLKILSTLNEEYIIKILKNTLSSLLTISSKEINTFLIIIITIIRINPKNINNYYNNILYVLSNLIETNKKQLNSIQILNIIGEIAKRQNNPKIFIKEGPISFYSLVPLLFSEDQNVQHRVSGIVSVLILNSYKDIDYEALFASLMSLFYAYEQISTHYVSMALNALKFVDKTKDKIKHLKLLKFIFQPILAVSDGPCNFGMAEFLKFLKQLALGSLDNNEFDQIVDLITLFSLPKNKVVQKAK